MFWLYFTQTPSSYRHISPFPFLPSLNTRTLSLSLFPHYAVGRKIITKMVSHFSNGIGLLQCTKFCTLHFLQFTAGYTAVAAFL